MSRLRIGEMLVQEGRLHPAQLDVALAHQRQWGGRIGGAIVRLGFLHEPAILEAVGKQLGVPFVQLAGREIPASVLALVPRRLAEVRRVLPISLATEGRRALVVALADPSDLAVLDELAFATGLPVRPVLAGDEDLDRALERYLGIPPRPRAHRAFASRTDAIELGGPKRGGRSGGTMN